MISIKALSAAIVLSAAIATPTFAQATHHGRVHDLRSFHRMYNQLGTPHSISQTQEEFNMQNSGFRGKDPSRVGGWDPSLNPSGS